MGCCHPLLSSPLKGEGRLRGGCGLGVLGRLGEEGFDAGGEDDVVFGEGVFDVHIRFFAGA